MNKKLAGISMFVAGFLALYSGFIFSAEFLGMTELRNAMLCQWLLVMGMMMLPWSQNGLDGFLGFALGTAVGVMCFFFFTNLLKIYNVPPNTDLIKVLISTFGVGAFAHAAMVAARLFDDKFVLFSGFLIIKQQK
ncbi:hypothetical protein [Vibrio agarivorans]|uniref:DUF1097 domain-containing protein n=1 Tax=Vibrio agarivorans TaxID=153622 RepID=A0ABT7XZN7_9VIBR|nr:hypothetical protein [Vibrio agarivorans]MDN2481252.1 hypothetical protein [Vibrio agarivorans]